MKTRVRVIVIATAFGLFGCNTMSLLQSTPKEAVDSSGISLLILPMRAFVCVGTDVLTVGGALLDEPFVMCQENMGNNPSTAVATSTKTQSPPSTARPAYTPPVYRPPPSGSSPPSSTPHEPSYSSRQDEADDRPSAPMKTF